MEGVKQDFSLCGDWNLPGPQGKGSVPPWHRFRVKKQGWRNNLRGAQDVVMPGGEFGSSFMDSQESELGRAHCSTARATIAEYSLCAPPCPNSNYSCIHQVPGLCFSTILFFNPHSDSGRETALLGF